MILLARSAVRLFSVALSLAPLAIVGCDPVHASEIDALGGEAPGVPEGPLHRPGQPCLLCHDGEIGDPTAFSVGGTVFDTPSSMQGVVGATVAMTDTIGSSDTATTNAAGNFYVTPPEWTPIYPIVEVQVQSGNVTVSMETLIGRNGSCAGCHTGTAGPVSPGPITLTLDNGGTPP